MGVVKQPEGSDVRKKLSVIAGAIGLAAVLAATAGAAKAPTFHFVDAVTGAQISATQAVFKVHDSRLGDGAGVQTVKVSGLAGTDREITYYVDGSATSTGSFKLSAPDANGVSTLSGQGHDTGGTGKLKGFKSTYKYTGTFNTKTFVYSATLKGTGSTK
jgi:hypothetical protein